MGILSKKKAARMDSQRVRYYVLPMQIDHDREEPPRDTGGNFIYWAVSAVVVLIWISSFMTMTLDWPSIRLGALSGGVFVIVMTKITGDKVPPWMRRR
jgi:hypothetical protein